MSSSFGVLKPVFFPWLRFFEMGTSGEDTGDSDNQNSFDEDSSVLVANQNKTQRPKRYKVVLHNDDYTTMEFVILVLQKIFYKSHEEANEIMLKVHQQGSGVCGVYTYEVAESKALKVSRFARENGHPLKCSLEKE